MRWIQIAVIAALAATARADGSGSGGSGPQERGHHHPPKAAFDACAKAKHGDACSFVGRGDRTVAGACEPSRGDAKVLVCRVHHDHDHGSGSGASGGSGGSASGSAK